MNRARNTDHAPRTCERFAYCRVKITRILNKIPFLYRSPTGCWIGSYSYEGSYMILQDPTWSYKILQDPTGSYKILHDPTRSYKILQDPTRSYMILQDPTWSYRILQDPTWSYKILQDPVQDFYHGCERFVRLYDYHTWSCRCCPPRPANGVPNHSWLLFLSSLEWTASTACQPH